MQGPPEGGPSPATRRLFFALWPDEAARAALARSTARAARASGGRPVPPASFHVTLAFMGSVPVQRVGELHSIARRAAAQFAHEPGAGVVALRFEALSHWTRAQVLVVLAADEPRTQALAATLKDRSAAAGFRPDLKPFHAHVTVARKVVHAGATHALRPVVWRCDGFALIDSRTHAGGALYSVVESFSLVKTENAHS